MTTGQGTPRGLALDGVAGKLYWADYGTDKIQRSNLDGTEVEDVITGLHSPLGLALDGVAGKLYWADYGTDKIQRSNLDGTEVEDLITSGLRVPRGLALDASAGKLYWSDSGTDKIQRATLDGTEVEDVIASGLDVPRGLALDAGAGKLYWSDSGTDKIQRVNLDGSGVEDVVAGLHTPARLALGPVAAPNLAPTLAVLADRRATAGDTLIIAAGGGGRDPDGDALRFAVVTSDSAIATARAADSLLTIFAMAAGRATITVRVRDPGGLEAEQTFVLTVQAPNRWPVAVVFLYWADGGGGRIQRSNLDGTGVEEVVTGVAALVALALDGSGGRIYWADGGTGRIQRVSLDGFFVEEVVTGLEDPCGLSLDVFTGNVYWADAGTGKIQRSNLDGTEVEEVITGLEEPCGLALGPGLPAQILRLGQAAVRVDLSRHFRDPEGGELTYTAAAADSTIARVRVADSLVTVASRSLGRTAIAVTAADGQGLQTTQTFAVTVQPRNRGPKARTLGSQRVRLGGTALVDLSPVFSDPNGDPLRYSASSSNEAVATVSVEGTGVHITAQTEGQATIMVKARDPWGLEATQAFGLTVEPKTPPPPPKTPPTPPQPETPSPPPPPTPPPPGQNNAPTFDEGSHTTRRVAENTGANRDIQHPVRASDDGGHRLTYRLSGTDEARFAIVSGSGQLRTRSGVTYDHEVTDRYEVTMEVDDPYGGTDAIGVTVHVADVDEPPQAPARPQVEPASSTSLTVIWTEPANTGPGMEDYDVQYRKDGSFLPWPHDGTVTTTTITDLDLNTRYEVQVRAHNDEGWSDWSPSGTGSTSANEPPVFTDGSSATRRLDENTTGVENIGDPVSATDPEGTTLTYSLEGQDADAFTLDETSGQLRTNQDEIYDYETTPSYSVNVKATDEHGGVRTIPVSIHLNDVPEPGQPDPLTAPGVPTAVAVYSITCQELEVRWSSSDYAATSGFKVQWKSGTEEYDASRQASADPATSLVSASSTETSRRYKHTIDGLTDAIEYTVRVIATNSEGDSDPSPGATGIPDSEPGQVNAFVENEVVAIHESSFPWLRDALSYLVTQNVPMMFSRFGSVFRNCPPSRGLLPKCSIKRVELGRGDTRLIDQIVHELGHVYTLANFVTEEPGPVGIAYVYFSQLDLKTLERGCSPSELYADVLMILVLGDDRRTDNNYWSRCMDADDSLTDEALAVASSAASGEIPTWFADTYDNSDGEPDLEAFWVDVKATSSRAKANIVAYQLRNEFGGYCDEANAAASVPYPLVGWDGDGPTRNPWRDGGCVPEAPGNSTVTAVGSGKLTVYWAAPAGDGGSPVEGYKVQWKSGSEEYDPSRQAEVTDLANLSHTISDLTSGVEYTVQVLAYNTNGDGAASVELRETATAGNTP